MNKVKQLVNNSKLKVAAAATTAAVLIPSYAFAADETSTAISTALTGIKTDLLSAIAVIAPLGIAVFGATFIWKKGISFFSSIARK